MTSEKATITGVLHVPYEGESKEKPSFTKSIMTIVMLLYFLGAIMGGVLVILAALIDVNLGGTIDTAMFIAYAAYIGGPTATAIGFYAWKSKAENILKIQNTNTLVQKEADTTIASALANMKGD